MKTSNPESLMSMNNFNFTDFTTQHFIKKIWKKTKINVTYLEKDFDFTGPHIRMRIRVMNQHWNLLGSNLLGTITKDKKHRVNHVAFATTIGAHNGWKTLMERSQSLFSIVRLEILVLNVSDHQPRPVTFKGQCWWRWRWDVNPIDVNSTVFVTDFFRWIWRSLKTIPKLCEKQSNLTMKTSITSSGASAASSVSMFSGGVCSTSISSSVIFWKTSFLLTVASESEFFRKLKNKTSARVTDLSQ